MFSTGLAEKVFEVRGRAVVAGAEGLTVAVLVVAGDTGEESWSALRCLC